MYHPGLQNGHADVLNRLPLRDAPETTPVPGYIVQLSETTNSSPVDWSKVKLWTARDLVLSQVLQFILHGWSITIKQEALKPYFARKGELSLLAGCVLCCFRVVIPPQRREEVLHLLHESHPGIVTIKNLARSYVWWPRMDTRLEEKVKTCQVCQSHQKTLPCSPLHPWEWQGRPWPRIHVDYAGPPHGKDVPADYWSSFKMDG